MTGPLLSDLITPDRVRLSLRDAPGPALGQAACTLLLVHGLGEHAGRYDALAQGLVAKGYAVRAYDQVGHGRSDGVRGGLADSEQLLAHVQAVVAHTRSQMPAGATLVLLGHSMGGLVVAAATEKGLQGVDALVMSSPALDAGLSGFQQLLVTVLPLVAPNLRVSNGLSPEDLSHERSVVDAYKSDPLCHDRISARLAQWIALAGPRVVQAAPGWTLPTLLLYSDQDQCVNPAGSRAFAKLAPSRIVSSHAFAALKHEIFNEGAASAPVVQVLLDWLSQRLAAHQ